jgi:hypothetical protein
LSVAGPAVLADHVRVFAKPFLENLVRAGEHIGRQRRQLTFYAAVVRTGHSTDQGILLMMRATLRKHKSGCYSAGSTGGRLYGAPAKIRYRETARPESYFRVTDSRREKAALASHMLAQLRPAELPFPEWLATIQAAT